jgi:hypothetical protein
VGPDRLAGLRVRSAQDIAGLELLVGWAKQLRLVRVHKGRLVPVTVGELAGHFWEEHVESLLDEHTASRLELWRLATAVETAQYLGLLHELGIVEVGGGNDAYLSLLAEQPRGSPRSVPGGPTCCSARPVRWRRSSRSLPAPTPPR